MLPLYGMKIIIGIISIAAIAFGGWWLATMNGEPTITLERDTIAATVNGTEISGDDVRDQITKITAYRDTRFSNMTDVAQQAIYNEALDTLIKADVLEQAVKAAGISVASTDIDAAIALAAQNAGGMESLTAQLALQGQDLGDLRQEVKDGLLNQAYFTQTLPLESITVSEEEIQDRFNEWVKNATEANEPLPTLEADRSLIEAEIRGLKREAIINEHIDSLIAAADVKKS